MSKLHLFEGYGVELEYMVVDQETLSVLPVVDRILEAAAGSIVSEVEMGALAWSNELVLHVVELKTNGPAPGLQGLTSSFQGDVRKVNSILKEIGGLLLPTAMHPWMDPTTETILWPHEYSPVYQRYDDIFGCQGHGWSNLQSTHINLPFAGDEEFGRLHAAIRLILPLIPGLAASSPLVEGRTTEHLDNRLEFYRHNSRRVPSVAGLIIPEPVFTQEGYEQEILDRMYAEIAPLDPEGVLQDEFLNSRGAIARFGRGSIEIRVMDVQESPAADLAMVALIVAALKLLVQEALSPLPLQQALPVPELASVLLACGRDGEKAVVEDIRYLQALGMKGAKAEVREIWSHLLDVAEGAGFISQAEDRKIMRSLLERGPLAREILRALALPVRGGKGWVGLLQERISGRSTGSWPPASPMGRSSVPSAASFVVSCEHGGARVPKSYWRVFSGREKLLKSHRGWDPGALPMAFSVARRLGAPLFYSRVTRLLVDLNRSTHHPRVFSEITRALPPEEKARILSRWYEPYRARVRRAVEDRSALGSQVVHLGIHSFTPVLDGKVRKLEIGLLYDPARAREGAFCRRLKDELESSLAGRERRIRVRLNQPYLGKSDGLTTRLRRHFSPSRYLGIEVEVNQGLILGAPNEWRRVRGCVVEAIRKVARG